MNIIIHNQSNCPLSITANDDWSRIPSDGHQYTIARHERLAYTGHGWIYIEANPQESINSTIRGRTANSPPFPRGHIDMLLNILRGVVIENTGKNGIVISSYNYFIGVESGNSISIFEGAAAQVFEGAEPA